jgi:farnesyl-diphosphate farnesyltransferase
VNDRDGNQILKEVSRSFYLTLRLLPGPMRDAAGLAYLIARTSDTIADTSAVPVWEREGMLEGYADSVFRGVPLPVWPDGLIRAATSGERRLLERDGAILGQLARMEDRQAGLIREVVATIMAGQLKDLRTFGNAVPGTPVALPNEDALEDYTWCVAGCVGAFWTKLGFLTMGREFSPADPSQLIAQGINYGKGLQLVNILRDLPQDLAVGRCYLPVADPMDCEALMHSFGKWRRQAVQWISEGRSYAETLGSRRLRASTVLPALIAEETLELLEHATWETLQSRIKVPRTTIYRLLAESLFF